MTNMYSQASTTVVLLIPRCDEVRHSLITVCVKLLTNTRAVHYTLFVWIFQSVSIQNAYSVLGDIADDKYFRKANDSDATQFWVLYPSIGAHSRFFGYLTYLADPDRR